jgi:hypothetical protein
MSLTLGLTGMDQTTEAALKSSFSDDAARLQPWTLKNEAEADFVIVDMDSMYGPMSWLRLHAAGKRVIGLTTAPRTQADYRLARPFDSASLRNLLSEIAHVATGSPLPATETAEQAPAAPAIAPTIAPVLAMASAPAPTQVTVEVPPAPQTVAVTAAVKAVATTIPAPASMSPQTAEAISPPSLPTPPPAVQTLASTAAAPIPMPAPPGPASNTETPAEARGAGFAEWLRPGALSGRAQYQSGKGPAICIDFVQRQYFGPATLKPLAEYFVGSVGLRDFEQLDEAGWKAAISAAGGEPQPLARLLWFGALLAGEGRLMPGFNPDGKFLLNKWPQTEREYPRHFRISTAMMKGPMTVAEIATASGVPATDVIDFINANLATGFAEPAGADAEAAKGSLLGLLRGR